MSPAGRFVGLALLFLAVAGCADTPPPQTVVLITLDTTRADRLGCYGYTQGETPNLDRLAGAAVRFEEAQAPAPITLASHATMFTGRYPSAHGARYNGMFRLPDSSVTIAELLRDGGWQTVGVPASFPMIVETGIGQGFATYHDMFQEIPREEWSEELESAGADVTDLGIAALDAQAGEPLFLWLHYWEPHYPYVPPFPYSARFRDRPYDGEVAEMDRQIGRFLDALRERRLWERSLIVVAGDHGEGLYDHNEKTHAMLVYQSTLRVPLIVKPPGSSRARVVAEPVTLADVAPTIADYARLAGPKMEGISLRQVLEGDQPPRRALYFESLAASLVYGWGPLAGVRWGPWKYTRSATPELYDLETDPDEQLDLHHNQPDRVADLEAALTEIETWSSDEERDPGAAVAQLDAASLEILASLGYVGGVAGGEREGAPHPRDMIHLERDVQAVRTLARDHDFERALERCDAVLQQDPGNRYILWTAADAAVKLREFGRAQRYAREALEIYPEFAPLRIIQADLWMQSEELERAVASLRRGVELAPDDAALGHRLAVALYALGRTDEALATAERFIDAGAEEPAFLVVRAAVAARRGAADEAMAALRLAVGQGYQPRSPLLDEPLLKALRPLPGFDEQHAAMREKRG